MPMVLPSSSPDSATAVPSVSMMASSTGARESHSVSPERSLSSSVWKMPVISIVWCSSVKHRLFADNRPPSTMNTSWSSVSSVQAASCVSFRR